SYKAYLYQLVTCSIISWRGQMAKLPKLDDRPLSQEDWTATHLRRMEKTKRAAIVARFSC
ncbi:MAG: hypothetical protein WBP37_06815, partial [Candidatus Dechloromonas phosphoritropha]